MRSAEVTLFYSFLLIVDKTDGRMRKKITRNHNKAENTLERISTATV